MTSAASEPLLPGWPPEGDGAPWYARVMQEAVATRIVDSTRAYKVMTLMVPHIGFTVSLPAIVVLVGRKPGGVTVTDVLAGAFVALMMVVGGLAVVAIRRKRASDIAAMTDRLDRSGRAHGRVVKAGRVRGGFQLSVQMEAGPIGSFTTVVGARRSVSFLGRAVQVAYDRANPANCFLVPDW